jgi:adenosylhomocysteine nucleosidase
VTVVAVSGLRAEARLARGAGFAVVCAGGHPGRTAAALDHAIAEGARGLISFGIAGGLAPQLRSGTLIAAQAVIAIDGTRLATDPAWTRAVSARTGAVSGDIFGGEAIVATAAEKAALHARTGALAVDLESLVVARAARRAELPWIVLRAIADPSFRDLPQAALIPLSPEGTPFLSRVLLSALLQPYQIAGLIRTARETQLALRALRRSAADARAAFPQPVR